MKKKMLLFLGVVLLIASGLVITGCGSNDQVTEKETSYTGVLYFANDAYAQTGDESLEHLIRVADYKFKCQEGRQYFYLIDVALRKVPEGLTGGVTCIDDKIAVNDVQVKDGTATVDLASGKMNSGSLTEAFVIGQIVNSLLGSFEEIDQVQFLVDGEKAESLMGHFDVRGPFTREMMK